jgi:hypothetical protein
MLLKFSDFLLLPVYLMVIYYIGRSFQNSRIDDNPFYSYYLKGLMLKIGGGIFLVLIYTVYYKGGDTTAYFESAVVLDRLRDINFSGYLEIMGNNLTQETYSYFTSETGLATILF